MSNIHPDVNPVVEETHGIAACVNGTEAVLAKVGSRLRRKRAVAKIRAQRKARHEDSRTLMLVIEQYRSSIRLPKIQKIQLQALGLGRIGKSNVVSPDCAKIVERLAHVVRLVPLPGE
ncbi:MAG: hypothetical protein LBF66_01490 [Holosporales bacterium]|nr:hypothetical protein [Holosporales bacterium]